MIILFFYFLFATDNDCITTDLRKERGFQLINYTVTDKGAHVSNVSDLFNFGVKYNETYVDSKSTVSVESLSFMPSVLTNFFNQINVKPVTALGSMNYISHKVRTK